RPPLRRTGGIADCSALSDSGTYLWHRGRDRSHRHAVAHVGVVALGRKPRAGIVQRQPSAGATCVRSVPTTFAVNETPSWLGPGLRPAVESGSAQAGISSLEVSHLSGADGDESCFYAVARSSGPQDRRHVHLDG